MSVQRCEVDKYIARQRMPGALRQCFRLSDPALQKALHQMTLWQDFTDPNWETRRPDAAVIVRLQRPLEANTLAR